LGDKATVLVVDDEVGSRESLRFTLKPSFDVYTSEDGQQALTFIQQKPVDIITLDLKMPGIPGIEVLKEIRKVDPDIQVIIITAYATVESCLEAIRWGVFNYITKPFDPTDVISTVQKSIEKRRLTKKLRALIQKMATTEPHLDRRIMQFAQDGFVKNGSSQMDFVRVLVATIERRDPYTWGHSQRVSEQSFLLAERLHLSGDEMTQIQLAAYLHDIGKIGINDSYIYKRGKLTDLEWTMMKKHPEMAVELLEPLALSPSTISIIRHHHERFNGKGYPDGLRGKEIPLGARIVGTCDSYDAMTSDRPYRKALSKSESISELKRCSGSQFDPEIIPVFIEVLEDDRQNVKMHSVQ